MCLGRPHFIDCDQLYDLLAHEREQGFILWVAGPAAVFDRDSRRALVSWIRQGYVHGLLTGNALATHDIEAALFQTAVGQEIYSKRPVTWGITNTWMPSIWFARRVPSTRPWPPA
jgi:hypothetical protein